MESCSLVRRNHIKLLQRFIKGGGTEFLPLKDPIGNRKPFLEHLNRANELEIRLPKMTRMMVEDGRFLLYLQPNGRSYRVHAYAKNQYQVDRNSDGDIESVCVIYSYKLRKRGFPTPIERWIKLYITGAEIWQHEQDTKPTFDEEFPQPPDFAPVPNVFGFVPCREVLNPTDGDLGESDFEDLEDHIEAHDIMSESILENLEYFCRSPIVTTRDADEVEEGMYEPAERRAERQSIAYASGFRRSDRKPHNQRKRIRKIIGGVEDGELFQQLEINPVPADLIQYTQRYGADLRTALGGVDEGGIETATETRIVYGGVEVTAREKREALYTYGLCKAFEMAITAEEAIYLESNGEFGLEPAFDEFGRSVSREVVYRTAPVFVPTTKDVLDRSIVGRNLQRLGVDVKETLRQVYPDKSDDEIGQMVGAGGLPVEYLQDVMNTMQTLLQLIDPLTGGAVIDPQTGLPLAYSLIPKITKALDYGNQFKQPYTYTDPAVDRAERAALAAATARIGLERAFATAGSTDPVLSANDRAALGLSQPLPTPGSTVSDKSNWFSRNFPTFAAVGNTIVGLFGGGSDVR